MVEGSKFRRSAAVEKASRSGAGNALGRAGVRCLQLVVGGEVVQALSLDTSLFASSRCRRRHNVWLSWRPWTLRCTVAALLAALPAAVSSEFGAGPGQARASTASNSRRGSTTNRSSAYYSQHCCQLAMTLQGPPERMLPEYCSARCSAAVPGSLACCHDSLPGLRIHAASVIVDGLGEGASQGTAPKLSYSPRCLKLPRRCLGAQDALLHRRSKQCLFARRSSAAIARSPPQVPCNALDRHCQPAPSAALTKPAPSQVRRDRRWREPRTF